MTTLAYSSGSRTTDAFLVCGIVAGPLYVVVGLIEALVRPGFDFGRHSLSLLANGELGWIHSALLFATGLLAVVAAAGLRAALGEGPGRRWGPILIGAYGAGVAIAGLLSADPALGFPPGTPDGPPTTYTWHGIGHFVSGGVGFLCLIVACFVFARRFARRGEPAWALYSAGTGAIFLLGFIGIAAGNQVPILNVLFLGSVVVAWAWVSAISLRARSASV